MIVIEDILISSEVVEKQFHCNLSACKGACCVEGDGGAPLEEEELSMLEAHIDKILPFISKKGADAIKAQGVGPIEKDDEYTGFATPLIDNGACAYVHQDANGMLSCGIENAYRAGEIPFQKPISCHLYPIRVKEYKTITAVNYDEWEICNAACALGEAMQMPLYVFVKEALIRKFGQEFYNVLEEAARAYNESEERK